MAVSGSAVTVEFMVWDTSANAGKTGDAGNLTLRLVKDGTEATPENSPSEVDAANAPGLYKIALTGAENIGTALALAGKSDTADTIVVPVFWHNIDETIASRSPAGEYETEMAHLDADVSTRATASELASVDTVVDGIAAVLSGITSLANWLGALAGKTADTATRAEIAATTAGAGYNETTDSQEAIRDAVATVGALTITSGGSNVVDDELQVIVPRGDSYSLVVTVTDEDGDAIDLSAYDEYVFTVKDRAYRDDDDDTNALFQADGTLSGASNNILTFALTPTQTELGTRDQWYDCDIECRNTAGSSVRTPITGKYKTTWDVTRGS